MLKSDMALVNFSTVGFSVPSAFEGRAQPLAPAGPLRVPLDDLLYSPADHQPTDTVGPRRHDPYAPPGDSSVPVAASTQNRAKLRKRAGTAYLPPPNQFTHYPHDNDPYAHRSQLHTRVFQQQRLDQRTPYDNTGQYVHDPSGDYDYEQRRGDSPAYLDPPYGPTASRPPASATPLSPAPTTSTPPTPADRPPGFTKVEPGGSGSKTQLHAVLDYDEDYYDDVPGPGVSQPAVTPLQGPILLRNGTVPVVPLTSYPTVNNGSFYQIPILWTALSLALGYELQGQIIKGVPCVKRNYQLYCPTAGNAYPLDKIETFIDENKALIKRMYGSFTTPAGGRVRRAPGVPDVHSGDSYFRHVRQTNTPLPDPQATNSTGRIDACESKTEIMTPYWALNSARKVRAIVNTMHFEQAIHQEVCSKKTTSRCSGDCGCEQKYKWHRLLAYDPTDDCAGIFMDWFLFPSCCVCRCNP